MRKNYKDCKYCGGNVPYARFRLGYDYCTDSKCVGMGMKNLPVVVASGYLPKPKVSVAKPKATRRGRKHVTFSIS